MKKLAVILWLLIAVSAYGADIRLAWDPNTGSPWQLVRIDAGDPLPDSVGKFSGLVFMGGPMSVNDPLPWVEPVLALIRAAVTQGVPVIGHCLGGQLLAWALGGAVTRNPVKEIGWGTVQVEPSPEAQAWFGPVRSFESFHWHGESFSIPATAVRIAGSPWCPNQAYVQGPHLGMQCHVEITPEMIATWCRDWEKERAGEPSGRVEGPFMQTPAAMQAGMARRADALHAVADRLYDRWRAGLKG